MSLQELNTISTKNPSSPTLSGQERTSLPSNDYRSEPADLTELGQERAESLGVSNRSSDTGFNNSKSSHESSTKAEFYIGDEGLVQPSTVSEVKFSDLKPEMEIGTAKKGNASSSPVKSRNVPAPAPEFVPPDGGYGWVIAFSACIINAFIVGFIKSYGVLYVSVREAFPEATAYQASWLPVFLSTTGLLIAPVTGMLCRKFTSRKVSFVGGIFAFTGILLGAFAKSMIEMIFTLGLLTGIGAGLTTTPAVLITSLYFEKRRGLASSICVSGNAIGGFLFPPLIELFLTHYGLQGTLYIIAALQLHICAASMLLRPIRLHALIQQKEGKRIKDDIEKYLAADENETLVSPTADRRFPSVARQESLMRRLILQKRISHESGDTEEEMQLRYQLSFLRSCSMVNSIPDLTEYAKSWSFDQGSAMSQYPSFKAICKDGKSSLVKMVAGNKSATEMEKTSFLEETKSGSRLSLRTVESLPLNREVSRRVRQRMPSVLEMESDSQISLTEIDSTTQPVVNGVLHIDQNLNIRSSDQKMTLSDEYEDGVKKTPDKGKVAAPASSSKFFDPILLKSSAFWLMVTTIIFMATGAPHALFFLPAYATSVEIDQAAVIYLMSISSIVDLFGRLGTGFISELKFIRSSFLYAAMEVLAGIALLLLPLMNTLTGVGILLSLYGLGVGGWFVLIPAILAEHHGVQKLAASFGIARLFQGIMNFISPQACGLLIDVTNSYASIYYLMGSCMAFGGCLALVEPFLIHNKKKNKLVTTI